MTYNPEQDALQQIQQARRNVDALRVALQSPAQEEMEGCLPRLEEAVECLKAVEKAWAERGEKRAIKQMGVEVRKQDPTPEIGLQLRALSNELEVARRLVIHGAAFCESWGRMLGVAAGGYVASGEAAPLNARGSLSIKG